MKTLRDIIEEQMKEFNEKMDKYEINGGFFISPEEGWNHESMRSFVKAALLSVARQTAESLRGELESMGKREMEFFK